MAVGSSSPSSTGTLPKLQRRWSELPTDVLTSMVSRLSGPDDRIRFAAVCKQWRSAWSEKPPLTWTWMVSPNSDGDTTDLLSLSDRLLHTVDVPGVHAASICGSFENWLIVAHPDHGNLLLNPYSGSSFTLPDFPGTSSDRSKKISECWQRRRSIRKAILSSSPTDQGSPPGVVVAAICGFRLFICRPQGSKWSSLPERRDRARFIFEDIVFYKGLLHAVKDDGEVFTIDVGNEQVGRVKRFETQPQLDEDMYRPESDTMYLVESRGRLLMVRKFWKFVNPRHVPDDDSSDDASESDDGVSESEDGASTTPGYTTKRFDVLELQSGPPSRWVEVKSLGGHALFLGYSCSRSVPTAQYIGVEEDCIYFTDDHHEGSTIVGGRVFTNLDSGVFSMKDGSIKVFPCKFSRPPPLWLHFTHAS